MMHTKLIDKTELAPRLFLLRFQKPEGYAHKPGQFARLGLEADGGEPIMRAYSIASAPNDPELEFLITCVPGGALSPRLVQLEPGSEILIDDAAEGSLLPSRIPGGRTLWLMATGSGLSPLLAMIRAGEIFEHWERVVLVLGTRTLADASAALQAARAARDAGRNLRLSLCISREKEGLPAEALAMRITEALTSGELERLAGEPFSPESSRVLLCGNPAFVAEARARFKAIGIISPRFGRPGQLVAENFW